MKTIRLNIEVEKPFGNLFRKACVLVAVYDDEGKLLLGEKPHFYPPTITRLLGGGMDTGENPRHAAVRELAEELGVTVVAHDLKEIASFSIKAVDNEGSTYNNTTYLLSAHIGDKKYNAGDDVKFISRFDKSDLKALVDSYNNLSKTLWYKGNEGEFSWHDYAQAYAPIHEEVLNDWEMSDDESKS